MIDALPLLLGPEGYQISRSVRLRSSASAYFNRTFTTPTNAAKWTFNRWVKRGAIGARQSLFAAGTSGSSYANIEFKADDTIQFLSENSAVQFQLVTTQVFRDPSAWYNIHIIYDSANATSTDRIQLWINGVRVTAFSTATYPTTTPNNLFNTAIAHQIGVLGYGSVAYFDGYQTELNFIDGQALTPSSFGVTNAYGVWSPTKYNGTYGTNGFYLNFSDNSAATAAAIGKDYSGNGNNWTPNNISVTAGVTYDSMLDVPTQWADGGNGRGNYAVLNPLDNFKSATPTNGNLSIPGTGSCKATMPFLSGKWYWEFSVTGLSGVAFVGIATDTTNAGITTGNYWLYRSDGQRQTTSGASAYGASYTSGDVIGIAYDADTNTLTFYKNNTSQGNISVTSGFVLFPMVVQSSSTSYELNFGQRPFAYTPPSGFKALNTLNLPTPTILKGNQYFDATLYTGNGATGQTITNSGGMQPDLVWVKSRSNAYDNGLEDAVRGTTRDLNSNNADAEEIRASSITAFTSSGFTLGGNDLIYNGSGATYVAWQWKEGATQGFDIVLYTGNGGTQNISHNLGVAPRMMIVKSRSVAQRWTVYHASVSNAYLYLNETFAADTANAALRFGNNSAVVQPTSSVFTIGNSVDVNQNTTTYVAYLFSQIAGFSAFGSYTGNGSTDGPFVFCGFRPRFILWKKTTGVAADWDIIDTSRNVGNIANSPLYPNLSSAETTVDKADILSNGFKLRTTSTDSNVSGETYIFAAFAENPAKYSLAR